mgnify:CR=1 FL=1
MNKAPLFMVKNERGLYLQTIDINENYSKTGTAPTMSVRHSYCEYKTIWDITPKAFDYRTLGGYINILLNEYFWNERDLESFTVIPA